MFPNALRPSSQQKPIQAYVSQRPSALQPTKALPGLCFPTPFGPPAIKSPSRFTFPNALRPSSQPKPIQAYVSQHHRRPSDCLSAYHTPSIPTFPTNPPNATNQVSAAAICARICVPLSCSLRVSSSEEVESGSGASAPMGFDDGIACLSFPSCHTHTSATHFARRQSPTGPPPTTRSFGHSRHETSILTYVT